MKILKKVGIVFLILIVLSAIGNVIGGSKKDPTGSSAKTESKTESKVESAGIRSNPDCGNCSGGPD